MALGIPAAYSNLIDLCPLNIPVRLHLCISGLLAGARWASIRTYTIAVKFVYRYLGLGQEGDREIYSVFFGVFSFLDDEQAGGTMARVTTLYPSSSACEHTKHDIH
jgi:hypothetical protein